MSSQNTTPETPTTITVAYGDGIGPEIMSATLRVLDAAGAGLQYDVIEVGEKVYQSGNTAGIGDEAWASLARTKVFLKAPITTPQGGGYKSLNVTTRKTLGLFANVRPCVAYAPFVKTNHPRMDVVIVRENEEDLYAGIEHRQTKQVYQTLKLITQPGSEKIIRYAFEYARTNGRKKVTVMVKDNIMKLTDGLFHDLFKQVATEYPEIEHESYIIDIGAARLAEKPERFDVVVTLNLYGDIISDIAAEVSGSVGFGPSANIGDKAAMFEAVHGSAPDIAGQDIANPSGLLLSAVMMLLHLGKNRVAERIHNAWLRTIEDGIHTGDIASAEKTTERVGTQAFADAVIARLDQSPEQLECIVYPVREAVPTITPRLGSTATKTLVGADIFLDWDGGPSGMDAIAALTVPGLKLLAASNRGLKVWPGYTAQEVFVDHWRLRYVAAEKGATVSHTQLLDQQRALVVGGYDVIKTENLCDFDGKPGYSLMQGQ